MGLFVAKLAERCVKFRLAAVFIDFLITLGVDVESGTMSEGNDGFGTNIKTFTY